MRSESVIALVLVTTILATGCSSPPLNSVNSYPIIIRTALASQTAFERIYRASAECYVSGTPRLNVKYSNESKRGLLSYSTGMTTLAIDLAEVEVVPDSLGSVVLMRLKGDTQSLYAKAVPAWLEGQRPSCPYR